MLSINFPINIGNMISQGSVSSTIVDISDKRNRRKENEGNREERNKDNVSMRGI